MRSKGDSFPGFPVNVVIGATFPSNKVALAEMPASLSVVTAGQDDELRLKENGCVRGEQVENQCIVMLLCLFIHLLLFFAQ